MQKNNKNNNEKEEKLTDLKATIESMVEGEGPELSQEDEIKAYKGEGSQKPKKRKKTSSDEDDETEDDEHLKRLKQELLASLEKVNKLARQLFGEKEFKNVKELNIKKKYQRVKEKEQNLNETKQNEQEKKERSREE